MTPQKTSRKLKKALKQPLNWLNLWENNMKALTKLQPVEELENNNYWCVFSNERAYHTFHHCNKWFRETSEIDGVTTCKHCKEAMSEEEKKKIQDVINESKASPEPS
jgi:hypothetical protein